MAQPEKSQVSTLETVGDTQVIHDVFRKIWPTITDPNPLVLFGFRRFRTSHLLNLRALESELLEVDHQVWQAGIHLGLEPEKGDRLAQVYAKRHIGADGTRSPVVDGKLLERLRDLLHQYDEALADFNRMMTMETFALADHQGLAKESGLSREETFRTRLVQVDRPMRSNIRDPIQHWMRKAFRRIWYHVFSGGAAGSETKTMLPGTNADGDPESGQRSRTAAIPTVKHAHQNTAWIADTVSRFFFGLLTGAFLVVPMAILLGQEGDHKAQLITVSVSIAVFSLLVALVSRASPQETMAASAAYAAVLVVFVSTSNVG